MTEQEVMWAHLLMESVDSVREAALAEQSIDRNALFHLLNRAETLMWHLEKRSAQQPAASK